MPTYSDMTPEVFLQRMVETHGRRFDARYWDVFSTLVQPRMPADARVADLGCGPGLFTHDLTRRLPDATFDAWDRLPEMVAYGRQLTHHHSAVTVAVHDFEAGLPVVVQAGYDFISLNFFLHFFDTPHQLLQWVRTALKPGGVIQVFDWFRVPLKQYVGDVTPGDEAHREARMRMFAYHNRYSFEDLSWLLVEEGFQLIFAERIRTSHALILATPRETGKL